MTSFQTPVCLALATLLALSASPGKCAEDHSTDKAFIRMAVLKMVDAYAAQDAQSYVAYTDPDFVNVDINGKETTHGKEERLQKLTTAFADVSGANVKIVPHTTVQNITFTKEGATVIEESNISYTGTTDGKVKVLKNHSIYRDFWVKSEGGWLEKRSRTISSKKTLNGKPIT